MERLQPITPIRESEMPVTTKYLFIVSMDVAPEKEALFNEVYDREHVPSLLKVPGVRSVTRFKTEPAKVSIRGEARPVTGEGWPTYSAVYAIDSPDVLTTTASAEAADLPR